MNNLVKLINGNYKINRPSRFSRRYYTKEVFPVEPINYLFNIYEDLNYKIKEDLEIPLNSTIVSDDPIVLQMQNDISQFINKSHQVSLWKEIATLIDNERFLLTPEQKQTCILKAMATYATSHHYYGPVVTEWAESLLDTALLERRKLIFLARDGIAPYKAACLLKSALAPKYDHVELQLVYVSRTLTYTSILLDDKISSSDEQVKEYVQRQKKRDPHILRKYLIQECHLKRNDRCLFVDVGFTGSLINPIVTQLEQLGISIRFNFLISHTSIRKVKEAKHEAKGFLAHNVSNPLEVVNKSGGNPAVHWIEDTHQSTLLSPKLLVEREDGKIVPARVMKENNDLIIKELFGENPQICRDNPEEFLVKTYGLRGVSDAVAKAAYFTERKVEPPVVHKVASEERRKHFGDFLSTIHSTQRKLLIKH